MSRRASLLRKENPGPGCCKVEAKVRFPDELVFLDNLKENDMLAVDAMLRRASLQMDINGLNHAGMAPVHIAVLEGNVEAIRLLAVHGADLNTRDSDSWTPLHTACACADVEITKILLEYGADRSLLTSDGERPLDLIDHLDLQMIALLLQDAGGAHDSPLGH